MASPQAKPYDSSRWERKRILIGGTPSTPSEVAINYIRCGPPEDGVASASSPNVKGHILLIHGFPETSYQFRHVITPLADAGYDVIAPDYRGAGSSSRPRDGYEKAQLATDLHDLLTKHLDVHQRVHVVGHDIGGMVAHAYAAQFAKDTASVSWGECPLPGTKQYDTVCKEDRGVWHFHFHWQTDVPELLTAGREREYIRSFYERLAHDSSGISKEDVDYYAAQFSQAGAMRCGFDAYRAFHQDSEHNQQWLAKSGKSKVPCMMLNGEKSFLAKIAEGQGKAMYENVQLGYVKESGHWCAEENPTDFVVKIVKFVSQHGQ